MKILHVITSLRTGGAEKLMVDLLPKLRDLGNEVDLLVFDGIYTPFMEQIRSLGIKVIYLGYDCSVYNPLYILRLIPIIKKYDIVHTHNTACQYFVAIANLFVHTKIITTEHNTNNRRRGKWYWRILDRWMYRRYYKIVCISELTKKKLLEELGEGDWPLLIIHNGIDVRRYHEAYPISVDLGKRYLIVMVAAFRAQKDQDTLVRAMSLLPESDYELWLVGGDNERIGIVQQLVQNLHLENQVKFMGVRLDIPEILQRADVIVLSSHYEGLSLSCLESMASGKPFIASDVDGLHEIVDGSGILFPHEDAAALACAIRHCREDLTFSKKISDQCLKEAMKYDISVMAENYFQLYSNSFAE